ncbi:MAG: TonB-dependent receptor [Marinilabiliaceae bacterium]|nr:TonB-dependent receptor [Marinilabiliaceae bacterium]
MNLFRVLVIALCFISMVMTGQRVYQLSGRVLDENGILLPGASVWMEPYGVGVITDASGVYRFRQLQEGEYRLQVAFLGYRTHIAEVQVSGDVVKDVRLEPLRQTLEEVVVTDDYARRRQQEQSLAVEVVGDDFIRQYQGGSLMLSLARLPGVGSLDIGSGQSKPMIRGLGFNRVVVVENGIRHEGQQWGADHGLEIDQYAVERAVVIKGPASLLYGSDAIAGTIDLSTADVPAIGSLGGVWDVTGKSNNRLVGNSLLVRGRGQRAYFSVRGTFTAYGDYHVPADSVDIYSYRAPLDDGHLRNTAGREANGHLTLGWLGQQFSSRLHASVVSSQSGFFANAHGLEPRRVDTRLHDASRRDIQEPSQQVWHLKLINRNEWHTPLWHLEGEGGYQRNVRHEWSPYTQHGYMPALFPDTLGFASDLERAFDKHIVSGNVRAHYVGYERLKLSMGMSAEHQVNRIDGRNFLIPAYRQTMGGVFAYGRYQLHGAHWLHAGVRFDAGVISSEPYADWFPSPVVTGSDTVWMYLARAPELRRTMGSFTWSMGYHIGHESWSLKANLGKSFRMPIAKELAANGVNYHHFSYEVGNAGLSPEVAYQADGLAEWRGRDVAIGITPFVAYFSNYIYLNPEAAHDRLYGNGNQVFTYEQSRVLRYGGEWHMHWTPVRSLTIGAMGEVVVSRQLSGDKQEYTLPFSPPASLLMSLRYAPMVKGVVRNPYVSIECRMAAPQNRVVPPEEKTPGYQVVNVGIGGDLTWGKRSLKMSLQVQNLLDVQYFNHISFYRMIHVPEPGRNVVLNVSIPIFEINN